MTQADDVPTPFARGGAPSRPHGGGYAELEALLDLVEALCPRWPVRPISTGGQYRL